nr:uncharacterized protein LOC117222334 isoform X3 [Megalopta genalis]
MRKGFTRYDEGFRTPASTDDESYVSSDFDLLKTRHSKTNPGACHQPTVKCTGSNLSNRLAEPERTFNRRRCFASYDHVEIKLLTQATDKDLKGQRPLSLQHLPCHNSKKSHEPQVTFAVRNSSSGGGGVSESKAIPKLCADRNSTPRIIRAIRRNSKKAIAENRSESTERPRPGNSKSSVVVLYHGKPASPEPALRACQSERSVAHDASQSLIENVHQDRSSSAERGPVYPIDRGQATLRRRRRLSRRRGPLAHIYRERAEAGSLSKDRRRVTGKEAQERRPDPTRYSAKSAKNLIRSSSASCQEDDSDDPDQARRSDKHRLIDKTRGERCRPLNNAVSKLMARFSLGKGDDKPRRNKTVYPNLAYLMHQMHACPQERGDNRAFISVNDGGDGSNRVFPFQSTPSGNLKIVPNQSF